MTVQWQGPTEVKTGDAFQLKMMMRSDQPVTGLPMALTYNPKSLQVIGVTEGSFLKQGGGQSSFNSRIEPGGRVLMTGTRTGDGGATALADVATITFKALAPVAASTVQLQTCAPIGLAGKALPLVRPADYQVQIN